jgi:hypothetical protein
MNRWHDDDHPCDEQTSRKESRLDEIERRLRELKRHAKAAELERQLMKDRKGKGR